MIYLEEANLLFLKPFKVAGTSFEIALSKFASPNDIISSLHANDRIRSSLNFPGPQNHKYSWREVFAMSPRKQIQFARYTHLRVKYPQHTNAKMAHDLLGARRFHAALKISIVRNPFDYLISHYFNHNQAATEGRVRFSTWIRQNPWVLNRNDQFYYLAEAEIIDYYLQFEKIHEDVEQLEKLKPEIKGLAKIFSSISANSRSRPEGATVQELFREQSLLVDTVKFFQNKHINKFGYSTP